MFKKILASIALLTGSLFAQVTPLTGLNRPTHGTLNWDVQVNQNWDKLDGYLGGSTSLPNGLIMQGRIVTGNIGGAGNSDHITGVLASSASSQSIAGEVVFSATVVYTPDALNPTIPFAAGYDEFIACGIGSTNTVSTNNIAACIGNSGNVVSTASSGKTTNIVDMVNFVANKILKQGVGTVNVTNNNGFWAEDLGGLANNGYGFRCSDQSPSVTGSYCFYSSGRGIWHASDVFQSNGQQHAIVAKTTTYLATKNDEVILADATGGPFTITLPVASSVTGAEFTIKKADATANLVTVSSNGSFIDIGASYTGLSGLNNFITVVSGGAGYYIKASNNFGPTGVVAGSQLVSNGVSAPPVYQTKPTFDVRDYGATGVGSGHDDLAAINAALFACSNTGGAVIFPPTSASYYVTNSITAVSNCTLQGQGLASITIPVAGWALVAGSGFGIINIYQVSHVRVTGLHIIGNKTAADANHSPKLIYLDPGAAAGAQNIQIDHNWLDTSAFEGIWVGCTSCAGGVTAKAVAVTNNYVTHSGYGGANATQGLPAIQCNWEDGVVADNRLVDVGTGIGCEYGNTVTGNTVDGFQYQGIAVGDGGNYSSYTISGNSVKFIVTASLGSPQVGYFMGGGVVGTNPIALVTGNSCYLTGTVGQTAGRCFWGNTAPDTLFSSNVAEIHNAGIGFQVQGGSSGTTSHLIGNTCKFLNETDSETCFAAVPNGGGNTLTIYSQHNQVYGLTRANSSFAFDYSQIGGGTLNAYVDGDIQCCAFVRVGFYSGSDATPASFDNVPMHFSSVAGVNAVNVFGLGQAYSFREQAAVSGIAGQDLIWADSTAHRLKMLNNNGTATNILGASDWSTYNAAGTLQASAHVVTDRCTLGTNCSITLSGSAVFTSSSSYNCTALDRTGANAIQFAPSSGSAFALTGTGTDLISYICVGN